MLSPATYFLSLFGYPRASSWLAAATSPPNFRTSRLGPASTSRCSSAPSRCSRHSIQIWWTGSWRSSANSASTCAPGRPCNGSIRRSTVSSCTLQRMGKSRRWSPISSCTPPDGSPIWRRSILQPGVATENGRVKLNEFLQSVSNSKVYAAGGAASSGPPLTPVSSHDGKVVAQNLLDGNRHRPDYRGVPSVAFTIPPIAAVGLSEAEARAKGIKFRMHSEKVPDWYTALRLNESVYGFKTLVEEDTDRILGAHLVGPHAEEVINLFGLAIRHGLTTKDLKTTMFAYPTGASDIGYML